MEIKRLLAVYQNEEEVEDLAIKHKTTKSVCGYITLAVCELLSEQPEISEQFLKQVKFGMLAPYIEKVMVRIAQTRKMQVKKFMKLMNESQRKSYMTDWVATFEMSDYLDHITDKMINPQVYFFRQVSFDHPDAMQNIKFEEAERVKEELDFKGQKYFYTSFGPMINREKENFVNELKIANPKLPIIIATDVLGHFNTTVLFGGNIYVLDSLPHVEGQYDNGIVEAIRHYYLQSFLKE